MDKMSFKLNTGEMIMNISIFNRGFLKSKLIVGKDITIIGKYDKKHNSVVASELRFGKIEKETIEPVYHTTYGLGNNQLASYINEALKNNIEISDGIPEVIKKKYEFNSKIIDLNIIHNPDNLYKLKKAINHFKYEELFAFMLKMNYLKNNKNNKIGLTRNVDYSSVEQFINSLPFTLTDDQLKAVKDIYNDLNDPKRMNRLLQGDVGSGKTIVAIISMYINYLSGYQSALMVPTEILAIQHYNNICNLFKDYGINVALLTGKLKAKEKGSYMENWNLAKLILLLEPML